MRIRAFPVIRSFMARPSLAIFFFKRASSAYFVVAYSDYTLDCIIQPYGSSGDPHATNTRLMRTDTPGFVNASAGDPISAIPAPTSRCIATSCSPRAATTIRTSRTRTARAMPAPTNRTIFSGTGSSEIFSPIWRCPHPVHSNPLSKIKS